MASRQVHSYQEELTTAALAFMQIGLLKKQKTPFHTVLPKQVVNNHSTSGIVIARGF